MHILAILYTWFFFLGGWGGGGGSQSQGGKLTKHKGGLVLGMKGVGSHDARLRFCKRIGWDHGGGRYYTKYDSLCDLLFGVTCCKSIFWQSPGFEAQPTNLVTISSNSHLGAISQCEQWAIAILKAVTTNFTSPADEEEAGHCRSGLFSL
jgi:hypothetical protein